MILVDNQKKKQTKKNENEVKKKDYFCWYREDEI